MAVRRSVDPRTPNRVTLAGIAGDLLALDLPGVARVDRRKRTLLCFYHRKDLLLLPVDRLRSDRSWASRVAEEGRGFVDKSLGLPHRNDSNAPLVISQRTRPGKKRTFNESSR